MPGGEEAGHTRATHRTRAAAQGEGGAVITAAAGVLVHLSGEERRGAAVSDCFERMAGWRQPGAQRVWRADRNRAVEGGDCECHAAHTKSWKGVLHVRYMLEGRLRSSVHAF